MMHEIVTVSDEEDDIENKPNYVRFFHLLDFRDTKDLGYPIMSSEFKDPSDMTWQLKMMQSQRFPHDCLAVFLLFQDKNVDKFGNKLIRNTFFKFGYRVHVENDDLPFDRSNYNYGGKQESKSFLSGTDCGWWECFKFADLLGSMIEIVVELYEIVPEPPYDSKKSTGMVGLKNQGATCYMNSLLQTLYHCNKLRSAVYAMPTEDVDAKDSLALALQRVFWRLQTSSEAVSTIELTKTFGWAGSDSFQQQDVQELNRVLCDKLEEKMKGTCVEGTIKNLFEGQTKSYIRCINVPFESAREESFYDISLDVKGCENLEESFRKYVEVEKLDKENQYDAEGEYGKQDAEKGVHFLQFPPVLNLQLKRFEYDMQTGDMVKINDRFEFPERLDLSPYLEDQTSKEPNIYLLHSVLVHSGGVGGGHYYAYVRPQQSFANEKESSEEEVIGKKCKYFKFDDERVTKERDSKALAYGGFETNNFRSAFNNCSSAYMLVYVKESELEEIMVPVAEEDIPLHLSDRFKKEVQDKEARLEEKHKQLMMENIAILTAEDVASFDNFSNKADFCELPERRLRMSKDACMCDVLVQIEADMGIPASRQRLWTVNFRNRARRVGSCITKEMLRSPTSDFGHIGKLKVFYLEVLDEESGMVESDGMDETYCGVRPYPPQKQYLLKSTEEEAKVEDISLEEKERVVEEYRDMGLLQETHNLCFFRFYNPINPRLVREPRSPTLESSLLPSAPPLERELMYVGSAYIRADTQFKDLFPLLRELVFNNGSYTEDLLKAQVEWDMYENRVFLHVAQLEMKSRFNECNMGNGHIITFSAMNEIDEMNEEEEASTVAASDADGSFGNEIAIDMDMEVDGGDTPPLTCTTIEDDTRDPLVMSEVDTPLKLPSSIPDYFTYRMRRLVIRFFPLTVHDPVPYLKEEVKEEFSCGESGCFELELACDQSVESVLVNLAHVLGIKNHLKIRLHEGYMIDGDNKSYLDKMVSNYAHHARRTKLEDVLQKRHAEKCRDEYSLFYEVSPYAWDELKKHVVLELAVNNYELSKQLISDESYGTSPTGNGKRLIKEGAAQNESVITSIDKGRGKQWFTSHHLASGVVTICVKVPCSSFRVEDVLKEVSNIYQLNEKLRVYEALDGHIQKKIYNNIWIYDEYNCIIRQSHFSSHPPLNIEKRISILDIESEIPTEDITIEVVRFVRVRNVGPEVKLQGLPHVTYVAKGESIQDVIDRVQPRCAPCYPQLSECSYAFISGDNKATLFEGDYAEMELYDALAKLHVEDPSSNHCQLAALGFEMSAPIRATQQVKKARREGGIKIDC